MDKKSIIELLGITPAPWVPVHRIEDGEIECTEKIGEIEAGFSGYADDVFLNISKEDENLVIAAPEMLTELADSILMIEQYEQSHIYQNGIGTGDENVIRYHHKIEAIEKACHPLKWPEIKEIISAE